MITAIRTNNFKKLENFSASFKEGTNLIIGENGQGKSTIFEAVRFALFGSRAVSARVEALTTWNKYNMWVELDILGYTIRRTSTNCKITNSDGELVATGSTPCVKFIEDLLNCPFKDFDLVFMSKQSEAAGLITFGAAELNRKVEEFAGVAVIDRIAKELGSESNGLKVALDNFQYEDTEELIKDITYFTSQQELATAELNEAEAASSAASSRVAEVKSKLGAAQQFNAEQDRVEAALSNSKAKQESLSLQLQIKEDELRAAEGDLEVLFPVEESEVEAVRNERALFLQTSNELAKLVDLSHLKKSLAEAEENVGREADWKAQLVTLQEVLEVCQADFDKESTQASLLSSEVNTASKQLNGAKGALVSGKCSSCGRAYEDHKPEVIQEEIDNLTQVLAKAEAKQSEHANLLSEKKRALQLAKHNLVTHSNDNPGTGWSVKVDKLASELKAAKAKRSHLEQRLLAMRTDKELSENLEQLLSCQQRWSETKKRVKALSEAVDDLTEELYQVNNKLEQVSPPKPRIDTARIVEELNLAHQEAKEASEKAAQIKYSLAELTSSLSSSKVTLSRMEANNAKMAELSAKLATTKQLAKYLKEERIKFMNGVWNMILGTATNFINKSTSGWITSVGRNDSGDFTFTENGFEAIAKESASGAQKAFIGTALKVGLAQAKMGSHSMVLLDEPTADMSNSRAGQLAAGLMGLSGQKIMITHRSSERMIAQNVIQVGE